MADEALQVAFEIKTACDEISRKLLRWHWEQKPGNHSLDALLEHLARRQQESPDYYDRMPDLSGKTSWSQLDTTLCMRVLLDPEKDAAKPLDLLGNTAHPAAARRACNAVRTARNEAAHATDRTDAAQAAILFNEAIESLEEGYAGSALRTSELQGYYRQAEEFLGRAGGKKPLASSKAETKEAAPRGRSAQRDDAEKSRNTSRSSSGSRSRNNSSSRNGSRSTAKHGVSRNSRGRNANARRKKQRQTRVSRAVVIALLLAVALGLLVRAWSMGLLAK